MTDWLNSYLAGVEPLFRPRGVEFVMLQWIFDSEGGSTPERKQRPPSAPELTPR
jgi:hypothetical protein